MQLTPENLSPVIKSLLELGKTTSPDEEVVVAEVAQDFAAFLKRPENSESLPAPELNPNRDQADKLWGSSSSAFLG